jgi:adenine-specific DNA methylase
VCKKAKKFAKKVLDNPKKYDMYLVEYAERFLHYIDKKNKNQLTKSLLQALETQLKLHM